jgi:ABC-type branched-subunit amino acid transport system ATPase component
MTRLTLIDARKRFGGLEAIGGLSLDYEPGKIYSLIGPNGAGKSTVVNLVAGSYRLTSGSICLGETELSGLPKFRIARLGVARTYQNIRLFDDMTVAENLEVALAWRETSDVFREVFFQGFREAKKRKRRETILRTLADLRLTHLADVAAGSLSYGNQKRVEIARALIADPQVIMLDEPAAGLNHSESAELVDLIRGLVKPDRIVILIEHDMHLVMSVSDWIHVLHQGRLLASGTPEAIRQDPTVQEAYLGTVVDNEHLKAAAFNLATRVRIRSKASLVRYRS